MVVKHVTSTLCRRKNGEVLCQHELDNYSYDTIVNYILIVVAQWLRCCATNRKVAGSIPDGVIGIFH